MQKNRKIKKTFILALLLCLPILMAGCGSKKIVKTTKVTKASKMSKTTKALKTIKTTKTTKTVGTERKIKRIRTTSRKRIKKRIKKVTVRKSSKKKKRSGKTPPTQRPYVIKKRTYYPIPSAEGYVEKGLASWYGGKFHGRKTSNGETYDMHSKTAAHKTLPMNTMLLVENLVNGKNTVVRINDRGPFVDDRIIDLSYATAQNLGIFKKGTGMVRITALAEEDVQTSAKKSAEKISHKTATQSKSESKKTSTETEVLQLTAYSKKKSVKSVDTTLSEQKPLKKLIKKLIKKNFDQGDFYIQVGAFEDKKEARKLAQTFADKGRDVIIQQFPAAGTNFFRVMIFSSHSLKEARKHKAKLERKGFPDALIIARDKESKKRQEPKKDDATEDANRKGKKLPEITGG